MMNITEFFTKPTTEIESLLKNNIYIKSNAIVFSNNSINDIATILHRKKNRILLDDMSLIDVKTVKLLTFKKYLEFKNNYIKQSLSPKTPNAFRKVLDKIISKYYEKDKYEIEFDNNWDSNYIPLKIYYPTINITNEHDIEHTMTDVYITYTFYFNESSKTFKFYELRVFRSSFTIGEFKADYLFSHLRGNPGHNNDDFCFGSTRLKDMHHNYINYGMTIFDIYHFILTIEEYFKWESISGTPWRYISKIKEYKIEPSVVNITRPIVDKYYKHVLSKLTEFNYSIVPLSNSEYIIKLSSNTKERIKEILYDRILTLGEQTFYLGRSMGNIFGNVIEYSDDDLKKANKTVYNRSKQVFQFKGEYIPAKVSKKYENITEIERSFPIIVNPNLFNNICNIFEKDYINYLEKSNLKIL